MENLNEKRSITDLSSAEELNSYILGENGKKLTDLTVPTDISAKLETMKNISRDDLANSLANLDNKSLAILATSAKILGMNDLANEIRYNHERKNVSNELDIKAEEYAYEVTRLKESVTNIDDLALAVQKYNSNQIFYLQRIAKKMYPNEPMFYEQIGVQHAKFTERKLVEYTAAYYSDNFEKFMEENDDAVLSSIKERCLINNLRDVIPDAVTQLFNYRRINEQAK